MSVHLPKTSSSIFQCVLLTGHEQRAGAGGVNHGGDFAEGVFGVCSQALPLPAALGPISGPGCGGHLLNAMK